MSSSRDQIRQVLERAAQLEEAVQLSSSDVETLLQAADEVGIPRAAVERALRERRSVAIAPPSVGQLVFAPSTDQMQYPAEVRALADDHATVRFLRGGERVVAVDEIRPCSFLPGERVQVKWPGWGTWTCSVVSYNADQGIVTVTDGWAETRVFPVAEVWINPRKSVPGPRRSKLRIALLGAAAAGAAIGSIVTAILIG